MKTLSYIFICIILIGRLLLYLEVDFYLFFISLEPFVFIVSLLYWLKKLFANAINDIRFLALVCFTFSSFTFLFSPLDLTNSQDHKTQISVLDYNIKALKFYESKSSLNKEYEGLNDLIETSKLVTWLENKPCDILCLQEFLLKPPKSFHAPFIDSLLKIYPYSFYNQDSITYKSDLVRPVLFSKYKIINSGVLEGGIALNETIYMDILISSKVVRIYNCHLYSNYIVTPDFKNSRFSLVNKLLKASNKRIIQTNMLIQHAKACPYPYIICGDLNVTPLSLTYMKLSSLAVDAHILSGNGYGATFHHHILPNLRIDYQFFSKGIYFGGQEVMSEIDYSDHYPLKGTYFLKRSPD